MTTLPIVMGPAGRVNTPPETLRTQLVALAETYAPGLTANLPGALIEDIASTDTGALVVIDQALTDLINSVTPFGANEFILAQLGAIYGVTPGEATNTSAFVVFTGSPGFVIAQGFTVSDGQHQYVLRDGGIVGASGTTSPLFAVATQAGTWAVPIGSITTLITSVPTGFSLSVTNPIAGIPSAGAETIESYRARVLRAGLAASQGMATYLKTLLADVPGVQPRLISVVQNPGVGYEVICGGGDPYEVAYAIFQALFDINTLVGATLNVTGITVANPGVVTTDQPHGLTTGNVITIFGLVGMDPVEGIPQTITVLTPTTFSISNTIGYPVYVSGGVVTPNPRNIAVTITDYPNTYQIPYVSPLQQSVSITLLWNTTSPNLISDSAVAQLGAPALVAYVNEVVTGQPMNLFELQDAFKDAVASVIPPDQLTRMVFSVSIDGVGTPPISGTGIIPVDPEGYLLTDATQITIDRG